MQGTKYHCGVYVHICIYVYNDTEIINTHRHSHSHSSGISLKVVKTRDFPGVLVVKTPHSQCWGPRFDPCSGN